uniref:Heme-binding protein 2 n=1 Tax=Pinguiococcus pyrenoidosus TaxID=172671 RepID=A0A7R9UCW7_9STRA|mmetsp:Transcript_3647/g.14351  ORF Transcript_3647/g.14351 Transcript_3647/m.14351 type:complete len:223 (+) Transcript_3647:70-738(+)|eukprot:scaffold126_cov246-Pinguiococcus_pyrenoidosus.AAC.3
MLRTLILSSALVAAFSWEAPWYCHDLDCPAFESDDFPLETGEIVEVRHYEANLWTSTVIKGTSLMAATSEAFEKLFDYLQGANEAGEVVDMTAPVLTYITPGEGPNCAETFKVSFYVPYKYQDSAPPNPTADDVFIEKIDAMSVAIAAFDGFATDEQVIEEAAELAAKLQAEGVQMVSESYYFAAYDPPFRLTNRHNEVWLPILLEAQAKPETAQMGRSVEE